jgi:hypothetical protein
MELEHQVKSYIRQQNWDLDLNGGMVKNTWGTSWNVTFERNDDCSGLPGVTYPGKNQIIVREPCDTHIKDSLYSSSGEEMAYTLAHEVGHADTWGISAIAPVIVLGAGIAAAVEKKSATPLLAAGIGILGCKTVLDELLAETAATVFHDAPFLRGLYLCLPDLAAMYEGISEVF